MRKTPRLPSQVKGFFSTIPVLILLDGCAPPPYQPVLPPAYMQEFKPADLDSASEPKPALPEDQKPSSPKPEALEFNLNQVIHTALKADPVIKSAFENITQAEADLLTAGLLPNPNMSVSGSLMQLDRTFTVNRQGGPPQFDAGISMPIDWFLFGKRAAAIASGQHGVDVATADFANTVRLRIASAIAAYYSVLEAQAMLKLAQENNDNLTKMERIIINRVALGGVGTIEADRIRLSIFSSHRDVHARELELNAVLNQLRTLLGIVENVPIQVKGSLEVAEPATPLEIDKAFKLAEENRPDLLSLRRQLDKANADISLEESKAYPQVVPKIGYTRQFQQQAIGFPDANSWGAGVDIVVPLFDRNQGNIARAKSVLIQSRSNLQAQLTTLRGEIDQAVNAFASAHQIMVYDDPGQLDAAINVRDKINQAYELGGKTLIEVLDAQRVFLETYRLHITSRSNYWHSLYQLNAVIGKEVLR
ncbi:TolC family protein [Methylomicrobium sp. Wu6]|uniref:TolC family protein n=1 Tax=Methylomicrobium sp. Wu6 TaxID=3107928 RepID=UPI002DD6938E|nr:TolC family protein [Methylomicrobium sp. Wu6]MEC4750594.1 TolC family protein [Methylomicrobium sp. Wu6]